MMIHAHLALLPFVFGVLSHAASVVPRDDSTSQSDDFSQVFKSTPSCGGPSSESQFFGSCLIQCVQDSACTSLGFDYSKISCDCPCKLCPDGKYYSGFSSYSNGGLPLSAEDRQKCPDVRAPCTVPDPSAMQPAQP